VDSCAYVKTQASAANARDAEQCFIAAVQHLQAGSERVTSALERGGGEHARRRAHLHQRRAQSIHDSPSAVCVCASHPSAEGRKKQPHLLQGSSVRRRATAAKDVAVEVRVAWIQALEVRGEKLDPAYAQRLEARARRYSSADAAGRKYSPSKAQAPVASTETPAAQEALRAGVAAPPLAHTHTASAMPPPRPGERGSERWLLEGRGESALKVRGQVSARSRDAQQIMGARVVCALLPYARAACAARRRFSVLLTAFLALWYFCFF